MNLWGGIKMGSLRLALRIVLWAFFCLSIFGNPIAHAEKKDGNISFRWAFGALVGAENDQRLISVDREATLKTGDKLKILLKLQKKCYVYFIYRSADGELYRLFPYELNQLSPEVKTSDKYYIPQGGGWFELDENIGREKFYLLASAERLTHLETLLERLDAAQVPKKAKIGLEVLSEIRKIRKRHKKFTSRAERPIPIGGSLRGLNDKNRAGLPEIAPLSFEISAVDFYYRSYTIDHQ